MAIPIASRTPRKLSCPNLCLKAQSLSVLRERACGMRPMLVCHRKTRVKSNCSHSGKHRKDGWSLGRTPASSECPEQSCKRKRVSGCVCKSMPGCVHLQKPDVVVCIHLLLLMPNGRVALVMPQSEGTSLIF